MKPMQRFPLCFAFVVFLLVATGAQAALYTVTLKSGQTFETRYEPIPADFDSSLMLLRTDRGNWIGLAKDEITDIVSEAEASGFGYQLDTTTLFLGWSPNDLVDNEGGESGDEVVPRYEVAAPPVSNSYSNDQFLSYGGTNPSATGVNAGTPLFSTVGDN